MALLVVGEAPRDDVLELAAEVQGLRRVVQRLARTVMWEWASAAATAVARTVVEARPPEFAKQSASTGETGFQNRFSQSLLVKMDLPGPKQAVRQVPLLQQSQTWLMWGLRSTAPRQNSKWQSHLKNLKLHLLGPGQYARPVPSLQQLLSLLVKLGLRGVQSAAPMQSSLLATVKLNLPGSQSARSRQNPNSQFSLGEDGPSWPKTSGTTSADEVTESS